ncbi:MAG TPA: hypothetical protein PK536_09575 [Ignavibacteria bacterium]|nr:hypothetical protein [Bacteroidota bacterium]HRI85679.1 hypothetical protein [Ignavibacteria bacterium]HRJ98258.1 hypothetical protein [Ignavibacteria bacterium]
MAKTKQQNLQAIKSKKQKRDQSHLHFAMTSKNYYIIGAGIFLIILGYILMNENSVSGFLPTVIAPILLVAGYCVVIPAGILYKGKELASEETVIETQKQESKTNVSTSSSNVKTA